MVGISKEFWQIKSVPDVELGDIIKHEDFGRIALVNTFHPNIVQANPHICIVFKISNSVLNVWVNGKRYLMSGGKILVIESWQPFKFEPLCYGPREKIFVICVRKDWLVDQQATVNLGESNIFYTDDNSPVQGKFASNIIDYIMSNGNNFGDFLLNFFSDISVCSSSKCRKMAGEFNSEDFRVRRALMYFKTNIGEEFSCADVATASGLSKAHFFQLFRKSTGISPRLFYNALRMERSYNWIEDDDLSVLTISLDLGFSAQSNFTRFFKSYLGLSPAKYRQKLRQNQTENLEN